MMKFEKMSTHIPIGNMVVKNRFVVPPMGNNFANTDGTMSEQSVAYYSARAAGGFGLITLEATVVHPGAKGGPRKPCLYDDAFVPSFKAVIDACHAHGAKVSIQLQNAGPDGNAKNAGAPIEAASAIANKCGKDIPVAVPTARVYELAQGYGEAAKRAMAAGADAVEIHMAHGYLVSSFISPRTNKRVDEFGGSFENRMRFPRLIVDAVKKAVGDKVAIIARINGADDMPGGIDVHDAAAIAAELEAMGVQGLHVSRAVHLKDEFMWAPTQTHAGFNAEQAAEIKRAVSIPIITVGRYTEPQYAELMVREGRADLVAFGRQSLADPELPNKALAGKLSDLTPCIACLQGCVANMFKGEPICCLTNPALGYESQSISPASTVKRVLVAGGGVGGLYAAYLCAQRGHSVTLYEASDTLGGNMRLAAFPPGKGDLTNMVRSAIVKCQKTGVQILLNTPLTMDEIKAENPDAVIVATGATTLMLPIPGIDAPEILHGGDVLAGTVAAGKKVLVVGGGMVGCETAAFLGERGHDVTVVEFRDTCGADVINEHRVYLMEDFRNYRIGQVTSAKVVAFYTDGVDYDSPDGSRHTLRGYDSVVLSMGYRNYDPLSADLEAAGIPHYTIGDATRARRALDATREAYDTALEI